MEEDIRRTDATDRMTTVSALVQECRRLEESCKYTSASYFIWLRSQRRIRIAFVAGPLVLGSAASWQLLTETDLDSVRAFIGICAFLAGLLPSIYSALKFDDHLALAAARAAEFKNLQDRFRQAAEVSSLKTFEEFERDFNQLFARLEVARSDSLTPPERFFQAARKKVKAGHYDFDTDEA